jgi:SAM-dependent methyltransferase
MPPSPGGAEAEEITAFLPGAGVRPGARVLDVPCGLGWRAHGLAERGFRVTAVDPNEVAIQALRARASRMETARLECHAGPSANLPDLPPTDTFDVILCLNHAISRDPPGEDVAFLRRLREHVIPGGLLLVDLLHRDFFASRPRPFAYHVIGDIEQHEFRTFDASAGVLGLTWKFYQRDGENLGFRGTSTARLKLRTPHEASAILEAAGWDVEAIHGGWAKEPVSPERRKLLLVARPARG